MIHSLVFIVIALVFALGKVVLERRLAPMDAVGDERRMGDVAFSMGCSVYDLFASAGAQWRFSRSKINSDFKQYLLNEHIPPYVSDYLAAHLEGENQTYQKLLFSGGRPPYL